tara:strand:+ start:172 stop:1491 length:1320 start_codon:yes stop_codon:yes gene_type:complete
MSLYEKDSIVALATPRGIGALAVIRVSGASLSSLFTKLTSVKNIKQRYAYYKQILSSSGEVLDNSLIIFFKGPSSFTGEDVIEISCHGGEVVSKKIINQLVDYGCRASEPGEFSKRAFLNGKIDLVEAESINGIIHSKSFLEAKNSLMSLGGQTQKNLTDIKNSLVDLLMIVEHELDFVEEEISVLSNNKIQKTLKSAVFSLKKIINGSLVGKKIGTGFRVVLVGAPNAGKSSLFNSLLGYNRAIVSSVKGTTRDVVEAFVEVGGYPVVLADTAGHHSTSDLLDLKGVKKTEEEIGRADIVVAVDEKNPELFIEPFKIKNKPVIMVLSKKDRAKKGGSKKIETSSLKNINIDSLLTELSTTIKNSFFNNEAFFTPERQVVLLKKALVVLEDLLSGSEGMDVVVFSSSLRSCINDLKEVFGEVYNEDVLNSIFKGFCVGK